MKITNASVAQVFLSFPGCSSGFSIWGQASDYQSSLLDEQPRLKRPQAPALL